jgi:ribonucleoside-diphosphate reductase alpha chain
MSFSAFANTIFQQKYAHTVDGRKETWQEAARRLTNHIVRPYLDTYIADEIEQAIADRKFMPGGRYIYAAGRQFNQVNNCFLFTVDDSRQGWADLMRRITSSLMTGGGVGVVYSQLREEGALVRGMGGQSTGPIALMQMVNEAGRHIMQGGSRRSAIWAGLHWNHPDVFKFINLKNWPEEIKAAKLKNFNFAAPMDCTNISVILDDEFFAAYHDNAHPRHALAYDVYWTVVRQMCETGEPGFSIDTGANAGEHLRNACTEVTSADDNDVCNLGSLNMSRIETLEEFNRISMLGTAFLLCGTMYSKLPFEEVYATREKNRRLGLGLMGMHEWLLTRGKRYSVDAELEQWLDVYRNTANATAAAYADVLGISRPVKTRAIAPTGTISIIAETTSGIEPVFCVAYKRRYLKGNTWHAQYVIDAAAQRLIDRGVNPDHIEDSYDLAQDVERRIAFQAKTQEYVDHGISSTINLPEWGSEFNNELTLKQFGNTLLNYLPNLRGITTYPDGSRGGQPLNRVRYADAKDVVGIEFEEYSNENACVGGVCGI